MSDRAKFWTILHVRGKFFSQYTNSTVPLERAWWISGNWILTILLLKFNRRGRKTKLPYMRKTINSDQIVFWLTNQISWFILIQITLFPWLVEQIMKKSLLIVFPISTKLKGSGRPLARCVKPKKGGAASLCNGAVRREIRLYSN